MISIDIEQLKYIIIMLVLIIFCSGLVGYNRGRHNQFAGLKTHLIVGIGAGLSFLIPALYYQIHPSQIGDPFRLSAQVISGIGFLGAGTIIKSGQSIKGLTTAASLWTTAIIAITIAAGQFSVGVLATIIIVIVLRFSTLIDRTRKYALKNLLVIIEDEGENLELLNHFMEINAVLNKVTILEHSYHNGENITKIKYEIAHRQTDMATNEIIRKISDFPFVIKIKSITEIDQT